MLKVASPLRLAKIAQGFFQAGEPLGMETSETSGDTIPVLDCLQSEKVSAIYT